MSSCSSKSSCEYASGRSCKCGCGGSNHGVGGRIEWAEILSALPTKSIDSLEDEQIDSLNDEQKDSLATARTRWSEAKTQVEKQQKDYEKSPGRYCDKFPRSGDARWFFEYVRSVDIVVWLANHTTERDQVKWIAGEVGDVCAGVLDKFEKDDPQRKKIICYRLGDHFWCGALAALAHAIDEAIKEIDSISKDISSNIANLAWKILKQERSSSTGYSPKSEAKKERAKTRLEKDEEAGLEEIVLENATKKLVREIVEKFLKGSTTPIEEKLNELQWYVRILALLMCPDPYAHRAVWEYCLLPVLKEEIVIQVDKYLENFLDTFKKSWTLPEQNPDRGGLSKTLELNFALASRKHTHEHDDKDNAERKVDEGNSLSEPSKRYTC